MNIRTNKFILLLCTLIMKFAIAGCFHSKCSRNQGKDGLSTDHSIDKLLIKEDDEDKLLHDGSEDSPFIIKLDCSEYIPGKYYREINTGHKIYLPKNTKIETHNEQFYNYEINFPKFIEYNGEVFLIKSCTNIEHEERVPNSEGFIHYLYFTLASRKKFKENIILSVYTDHQGKRLFVLLP